MLAADWRLASVFEPSCPQLVRQTIQVLLVFRWPRETPSETAESALVSCGSVDCGQFVLESVLFRTPRTPHVGRERAVRSPLHMLDRADNETASGIPDDNNYIGFRRYGDGCCLAQVA